MGKCPILSDHIVWCILHARIRIASKILQFLGELANKWGHLDDFIKTIQDIGFSDFTVWKKIKGGLKFSQLGGINLKKLIEKLPDLLESKRNLWIQGPIHD